MATLSVVQFLLVLAQATTAGSSLTGTPAALDIHEILGTQVITTVALVQFVVALVLTRLRWNRWLLPAASAALFAAVTIQGMLGFDDRLVVHLPLGLLILASQPALARAALAGTTRDATRTRTTTLLAIVALLAACSGGAAADVASRPVDDPDVVIEASDNRFDPSPTSVESGDAVVVELRNVGHAPHNLVADDGQVATDVVQHGEVVSFTVDPGSSWSYECTLHPGMTGTINSG